ARSGSTPNFSTQSSQVSAGGVCTGRLSPRASRSWYGAVRTTAVALSRSSSGTASGSNNTTSSPSSIAYDETSSGHACSLSHSGCGDCQCQTPGRSSRTSLNANGRAQLSGVLDEDVADAMRGRLARVDGVFERLVDVLPADHDHRVDPVVAEEARARRARDGVGLVLELLDAEDLV